MPGATGPPFGEKFVCRLGPTSRRSEGRSQSRPGPLVRPGAAHSKGLTGSAWPLMAQEGAIALNQNESQHRREYTQGYTFIGGKAYGGHIESTRLLQTQSIAL